MERGGIASAWGLVAVVAGLLMLASCTVIPTPTPTPSATPTPTGDGVLRVGTLLSASDPAAASQVAGVYAAVREINLAGGVSGQPVEVLSRNAGDAPDVALASLADLVAQGVDVVIGPASAELLTAVTDEAEADAVPVLSAAGEGSPPAVDDPFAAAVRREDPGVADPALAVAAYDAVVRAALAAALAADDGGASITRELPAVTSGEVPCDSFGACLDAVTQGFGVSYAGVGAPAPSGSPTPSQTSTSAPAS